jgi:hypothetical protein
MGRDSSVSIATSYGLEDMGIESRWDDIFGTRPDRSRSQPSLLHHKQRFFHGSKTTHQAPRLKKENSYTSTPALVLRGLFWGEVYITQLQNSMI